VVSIDLHLHGELGAQPFIPADVSPRLIEVIEQSVHNLALLVGAYQDSPVADGKRIGLLGISLGGVIIYYYLPQRSTLVKTAVTMVAGLSPFMDTTLRRIQEIYPQFGVTGALIDSLGQHGRSKPFLQNLNEFPLLMLYGKNDPIIPIERVREVFQTVQLGYKQPEKLRLEEFDHAGHETPAEMYARAAEWFVKYL
jgi:alpha-beta hydrolase superfamily lysophospholipase